VKISVNSSAELVFFHRENGYIAQPMPTPINRNSRSDQAIYFRRSMGFRRLKNPNPIEINNANKIIACK
jgi:hypothetical protein